jgi:hypothetical protein
MDYQTHVNKDFNLIKKKKTARSLRIAASENIGTAAAIAINAVRHGQSFAQALNSHTEFRGCGVVDLAQDLGNGNMEIKEAKGGSSRYGTRKDTGGKKKVRQCTDAYNRTIIEKMRKSTYKGRHPTVECTNHQNPVATCSACVTAERKHRQDWGKRLAKSRMGGKLTKISVRGPYSKTCLRNPKVLDAYKSTTTGKTTPVAVNV